MSFFLNFLSVSGVPTDTLSSAIPALTTIAKESADKAKFWVIDDLWHLLREFGIGVGIANLLAFAAACLVLAAMVWLIDTVIVNISLHYIKRAIAKSSTDIDDIFVEQKFFSRLLKLFPLVIVLFTANIIFAGFAEGMILLVEIITKSLIIISSLLVCYSLMNTWNEIYNRKPQAQQKSIKGYIQVAKIVLGFIAGILIVATLVQKDASTLFLGLGTAAALFSLVFKDTILGFVASIQLSAQDMVRIGDWISMPSKDADGTVLDINVNSVKVQNWDNTVTMIPIYSMVSESFTNWRGMEQSDGRRFVRYIYVNMESVKFADANFLAKINRSKVVESHFDALCELAEKSSPGDTLTNLALLRAHIELFLRNNPKINDTLPLYVRYKQEVSDKGIGIEIYAFSHVKSANEYDAVHRSVVEYVIASAPLFDIVLFQSPSGMDFQRLVS